MEIREVWSLGIDPGYGETGAVLSLVNDGIPVEAACWCNDNTHELPMLRAMSICIPMMEQVLAWITEHDIEVLRVGLEEPIYNGNPKVLMIQMSLFVMLQAYVYDYLTPHLDELYLTIVSNQTSKKRLTGNGHADKNAMINSSPWVGYTSHGLTYAQAHTLADAYAQGLCSDKCTYALHKLPAHSVPADYVMED